MGLWDDDKPKRTLTRGQKNKIIQATGGRCLAKGEEHTVPREALDVQHIKPKAMKGTDKLENLTVLCATHHRLAHAGKVIQQPIVEVLNARKLTILKKAIARSKRRDTGWRLI